MKWMKATKDLLGVLRHRLQFTLPQNPSDISFLAEC